MADQTSTDRLVQALPGIGIALGAGAGLVIALAVWGPPAIALGAGVGAALGLLIGAIARMRYTRR